MKKRPLNFLRPFLAASTICLLFAMTSCKQATKFAQVKYTAAQVNYWLDSKSTDSFIFQFYSPQVDDVKKPYQLVSYILDTAGNYLNPLHPDTLAVTKDTTVNLTGPVVLGNTYLTKKAIIAVISTDAGGKRDYDYLVFTPKISASNQHLVYAIGLVKNGKFINYADEDTKDIDSNPSPPAKM
ncbi:hypothetical protein SAMN05192574_114100 [Mucilaginibacter gossypiicola]|uniref:Uncharacterized protein n=1 Tax=Mucilaginibacter gossypiicola TaxID=551995 RepID=A0A1H8T4Y0_9SPHI|nr:hypothetical protein [Mucilaginibacter gossypiicola]SEO85578.1 hypothetical protein SAMN05192574_114100 [Mucilaginibacter gossypiicola]